MTITHLTSLSQLNGILEKSKDKLTVIDFHATWCGPCHAIAPKFESLSKQHKNVNFLKCDVDAAADVASQYRVSAMPTFVFLKGTTKVDQVRGADPNALEATVRKHASGSSAASTSAFSGKGHTLGGGPAPSDLTGDAKRAVDNAAAGASAALGGIDPQLKVFIGLIGLYALFYFLG
ncbi:thioredoxin-like protein [Ephemerocybe angulata]|uniref:Thioredoxin n=1 Tax=Ephemerocybe angulata TaxID=980116 RepID=A0A8H6MFB0_9AGAR|nr:thioredoxin-like protein [Tulosesus angulatus]